MEGFSGAGARVTTIATKKPDVPRDVDAAAEIRGAKQDVETSPVVATEINYSATTAFSEFGINLFWDVGTDSSTYSVIFLKHNPGDLPLIRDGQRRIL